MKRIVFLLTCISLFLSACTQQGSEKISIRDTKFLTAVKESDIKDIDNALAEGADINAKDKDGVTALMIVSQNGNMEIMKHLLDKGADVNITDTTNGVTSLWIASENGHTEIVKLLIEKKADVNTKRKDDWVTALCIATQNGHIDIVKLLFENGADIYAKDIVNGITALWIASQQGHYEIAQFLVEKGADINTRNKNYEFPIHMAALVGNKELVNLLINQGAYIDTVNINGMSSLHYASLGGNLDVIDLLLEKGIDINSKDKNGFTSLHMASECDQKKAIYRLLEKGAGLGITNNFPLVTAKTYEISGGYYVDLNDKEKAVKCFESAATYYNQAATAYKNLADKSYGTINQIQRQMKEDAFWASIGSAIASSAMSYSNAKINQSRTKQYQQINALNYAANHHTGLQGYHQALLAQKQNNTLTPGTTFDTYTSRSRNTNRYNVTLNDLYDEIDQYRAKQSELIDKSKKCTEIKDCIESSSGASLKECIEQ